MNTVVKTLLILLFIMVASNIMLSCANIWRALSLAKPFVCELGQAGVDYLIKKARENIERPECLSKQGVPLDRNTCEITSYYFDLDKKECDEIHGKYVDEECVIDLGSLARACE